MTTAELSLLVFATCNTMRVAAYFPQMFKVAFQPGAAASISYATWTLFMAANLSTAVYAGVVLGDVALSAVHAFSALCCGTLVGLALWRCRFPVALGDSTLGQAGVLKVAQKV
jgi:hypothetical protein